MKYVAILALLALTGCDDPADTCKGWETLDTAALFNVNKQLDFNMYRDPNVTQERIDRQAINIAGLRAWAATLKDDCLRKAYNENIDVAEFGMNDAKEYLAKGRPPREEKRAIDSIEEAIKLAPTLAKPPICMEGLDRASCLP